MVVHAALALWLAKQPRWEGSLSAVSLSPIAQALARLDAGASPSTLRSRPRLQPDIATGSSIRNESIKDLIGKGLDRDCRSFDAQSSAQGILPHEADRLRDLPCISIFVEATTLHWRGAVLAGVS